MLDEKGCLVRQTRARDHIKRDLWSFPGSDKANMASAAENDEMCEEDEETTVNNGERTLKEGSFL